MSSWQTPLALIIVAFAAFVAFRTLVWPFFQSMKSQPKSGCGGGCGCAKSACADDKVTPKHEH